MKKDGINIIGYIEQEFSKPKPVSYTNGNGFKLNRKGITGKENIIANIGYRAIEEEVREGKSFIKSNFGSKVKSLWN